VAVGVAALIDDILRRANVSRKGGSWSEHDYDVFDGDRNIGRIYLVDAYGGRETWFSGASRSRSLGARATGM
jgi:hypothetical protein